ncbi:ABC transporter permease [Nitrincola alkalilacustris]|uniref:ABC transporter permease n=1 Tax=Nitrincola alkalilacustris TaxID=1571224 RepID=UPI0019804A5A|nr:ABC transporter permease [Nitrincola alkalilacustris]
MQLSPINQERWRRFRKNRRGYWSLWVFLVLFMLSLFADFIANESPIMVRYQNQNYYPIFTTYSELEFGGEFDLAADYRDPFLADIINEDGWMIWPLIRFNYRTINYNLPSPAPSPPTWENWLGTDDRGRDVVARLLYGFRISVIFGFALTLLSSVVGITLGVIQGFYGGKVDLIGQRMIEVWASMPSFFILIIVASLLQPTFFILLAILLLFSWMSLVGFVRAESLRARNFEYVQAARALGLSNTAIMFRHVLPNALVATVTFLPFILAGSVTTLTSLDFLGFGLPPGSPSLGEMVNQGKTNLRAPWIGISVFITLSLLLTLLVFIGEAVRDAFDPNRTR